MIAAKAEIFRKVALDLQKAQTEFEKAKLRKMLVDLGVLTPADVRKMLVKENYLNRFYYIAFQSICKLPNCE